MKKFLSLFTSALMFLSISANAFAQTIEISIVEKPNIDILLTTGSYTSDLSTLKSDILEGLENDGINTSGIQFQTVSTSVASTDSMDASTIFNEWGRIGWAGQWSLTTVNNIKTIQNAENTDNYTGFYYNDSFDYKNEVLEFDNRTTNGDDDFMGAMIRFNINTDSADTKKKTCTTYIFALDKHDNGGGISNGSFNGLLKITNKPFAHANVEKLQSIPNVTWTRNTWAHYKIVAKGNNIKVYQNDKLIIDYTDNSDTAIESGSYGFFSYSQPYAQYRNFVATCETERNYSEVLTEPTWREDATHMIINVDTKTNSSITENSESLTRTLADDIHFIQWGNSANESVFKNFIKRNDNKGMFTLGAEKEYYNQAVENTVSYIESLLDVKNETQYVIVGRDAELAVTPVEYMTNASNIEFPNGRWIIHHDYTYFDNNLGQSAQTESYTPNLLLNFDKPGAYNIYFDDMLVKTVYAHRLPVADFTMEINGNNLNLTSTSFDEDSNINNGFGKGIAKETWYYKKASDTDWTIGKLNTIDKNSVYIIKLEVEDMQGATSYTTKYTGTGNPVASFITDKSSFSKYYNLKLTNTSYDPVGYDISSYKWEIKNGKTVVKTFTEKEPTIDFTELGAGTYALSLSVANTQGTQSESYTRTLTVLEDKTAPSITIDPTYSDWTDSQDINITINDDGSGLKQWKYVYTQSQDKPADSAYGTWQTSSNITLTFDTDGEYYLHVYAIDNAGNEVTRTVGSYKITHPYTNKVNHDFGVLNKSDFVTFDWGKWYNPTTEFEEKVNGFELGDTFMANYPTTGTIYNKTDRLKQPSGAIEYNFTYKPIEYTATIDYGFDEKTETKIFTVLEGFNFERPVREGYEFVGWYIGDKLIKDVNFNKNNTFASFEEFKNAMDSRTAEDITITAHWNKAEFTERTNVFAQIASEYKVTIPKTVVLSGTSKAASYFVKVEGDIAGYEDITVTPDDTFTLTSKNKDSQNANIEQDKTTWTVHDFDTDANGTISAPDITAGKWLGAFNFNIEFNTPDEENVNSEESIEYQTIEYPTSIAEEE